MAGGALGAAATGVSPGGAWGKSLPTFVSHFLLATASFFIVGSAPLLSLTILPGKKKQTKTKNQHFMRPLYVGAVFIRFIPRLRCLRAICSLAVCRVKLRSSPRAVREGLSLVWRDALAVLANGPGGDLLALRGRGSRVKASRFHHLRFT